MTPNPFPRNFRRRLEWQWRLTRIGGLLVWPVAILIVTAFRATRAGPAIAETITEGAIMIGGGFLLVAGAWCVNTLLEGLIDLTERKS